MTIAVDEISVPDSIAAVALAHGLVIMAFAFAFGSVSGGHINPAVSVGVLAAGAVRIWNPRGESTTSPVEGPESFRPNIPLGPPGQPAELAPRSTCF